MPKYEVTEQLSSAIRTVRLQRSIKAIDVAKEIGKTSAYISQLENGSLKTIKSEDLYSIILFLSKDKDHLEETLVSLLSNANLNYSKEESEQEEWILNFDYFYRKFNIPSSYINYVKKFMDSNNITTKKLTDYINKNSDLHDDPSLPNELINSSEKNHWYFNNGNPFIIMSIKPNEIDNILKKEKKIANYSLLLCILISLYKITGVPKEIAYSTAKEELKSFNIYTIYEKNKMMSDYSKLDKMHTILDQRENELLPLEDRKLYQKLFELVDFFVHFAEIYDNKYLIEKLSVMLSNAQNDPVLLAGFIGIDLSKLESSDFSIKKEFVKETQLLAEKMSNKPDDRLI